MRLHKSHSGWLALTQHGIGVDPSEHKLRLGIVAVINRRRVALPPRVTENTKPPAQCRGDVEALCNPAVQFLDLGIREDDGSTHGILIYGIGDPLSHQVPSSTRAQTQPSSSQWNQVGVVETLCFTTPLDFCQVVDVLAVFSQQRHQRGVINLQPTR